MLRAATATYTGHLVFPENLGHGLNVLGMAGEDTETKFGPPRTVYDIGRLGLGGLTNPEPLA